MNLKGIQQQQSGTSMEGAYANTNNHRGPSSASLDATGNEKFTDIIFMEEPAKVRILKNRKYIYSIIVVLIFNSFVHLFSLSLFSLSHTNTFLRRLSKGFFPPNEKERKRTFLLF